VNQLKILKTVADVQSWHDSSELPVAAVFTMGALHSGHAYLMTYARERSPKGTRVIASIFVNPTQFEKGADLETYPRTLGEDLQLLIEAGVDAVFIPSVEVMYPDGLVVDETIDPGVIGKILEGKSRPGHFLGMLSVVHKLLSITKPNYTFFGEKDFQQLTLVKKMVHDLMMPVEVVGVPTVRDPDGLALSSRNQKLSESARVLAQNIPAALTMVSNLLIDGKQIEQAEKEGRDFLAKQDGIALDYLEVHAENLIDEPKVGTLRILIAAIIDGVRIIDNIAVEI
jgi:pantoate--beta-alanine ligase